MAPQIRFDAHRDPPLPLIKMGTLLLQTVPHRDKLRRTIIRHGYVPTEVITEETHT
jgi:hypothetical protein